MENKLQELTNKLYDEGLSRGRHEAEMLIADARAEAKRIVSDAWSESERLRHEAARSAADLHKNTITELNLAGKQVIARLKHHIREMVVARAVDGAVKDAAMDPAFIREVLVAVCQNWQGESSGRITLEAMLPAAMRDKLDKAFEESVRNALDGGVEIVWSNAVKSGFRIAPKKGGYYINFTDDGFNALLGEYLRPRASAVLYGTDD